MATASPSIKTMGSPSPTVPFRSVCKRASAHRGGLTSAGRRGPHTHGVRIPFGEKGERTAKWLHFEELGFVLRKKPKTVGDVDRVVPSKAFFAAVLVTPAHHAEVRYTSGPYPFRYSPANHAEHRRGHPHAAHRGAIRRWRRSDAATRASCHPPESVAALRCGAPEKDLSQLATPGPYRCLELFPRDRLSGPGEDLLC